MANWLKKSSNTSNHTNELAWKYRKYEKLIESKLADALILHNMKVGNTGNAKDKKTELAPLKFNENWRLQQSKNEVKKGPVDVLGDIENINILKIKNELITLIQDADDIAQDHKERYITGIEEFIGTQFHETRKSLESKKRLPHEKFRRFYTKLAAHQDLAPEKQLLYRDVCLVFANKLYGINPNYLNAETGEINQDGLKHLGKVFLRAINNIANSGSSKAFHKVFHDGDFNFLRKENSAGGAVVGTLDHYVQAVMYLMDSKWYNAYAEGGEEGEKERSKSKKSLLNNIFVASQIQEEEKKAEPNSEKARQHQYFAKKWREAVGSLEDTHSRESADRLKTEASKMLKVGGRSSNISDESGLRVIYYENPEYTQTELTQQIQEMLKHFFHSIATETGSPIEIEKIQTDLKGNFLTPEQVRSIEDQLSTMLKSYPQKVFSGEIKARKKADKKADSALERIDKKYKQLSGNKATEGLKKAYQIANGEIKRGSNGDYKDFKLIVQYKIKPSDSDANAEPMSLSQEISFYPHTNELNMGNHHFLDLEKKIFNRVKNMNDGELGKTISLNRLRYFTETTLKDIAFDIDVYEDKIKRGFLPTPQNDDYRYLEIDGERIDLKGLLWRNKENSDRFDRLISHILNYFIKNNKLAYINNPNQNFYGLIDPEMLRDKKTFKLRRFLTSDVLKQSALDVKNEKSSISFYTTNPTFVNPNFYTVSLEILGDFIGLEKTLKS